jgi:hypothetical protein
MCNAVETVVVGNVATGTSFLGKCGKCKKHSQFNATVAEKSPAAYHRVTGARLSVSRRSWRVETGPRAGHVTPMESPWNGKWQIALPCHKCGAEMSFSAVSGEVTEKPCGARCLASKGPTCECACGGRNHGGSHC